MKNNITTIVVFVGVIWAAHLVNILTGHALSYFGIIPRTITGLRGIIFCPFIHQSFIHLTLNTAPLIILSGLVMLHGRRKFFEASVLIVLIGGLLVWLFARPGSHIGASGLIYGYFGFLAAAAWYERDLKSILIAIFVVFLYGGLIWGVLPRLCRVSWEGHLFGMIAGVLVARILKKRRGA